jgi:spore germination cell wall hydrolase CwlJ-like protein
MSIANTLPAGLLRAYPRETVVFGLVAATAVAALAGVAYSNVPAAPTSRSVLAEKTPPAPPPLLVRQLAPEEAVSINQSIPLAAGPNPAARPLSLSAAETARAQALECLTSAVYYEAGNESTDGQKAVAQVVLNRVRHPAFPSSVCGVVYQGSTRITGCQFTFTCDGSLMRRPAAASWARARKVAEAALAGAVYAPVGLATHYHADYVVPYWASSLAKNAVIGAHIFYRWAGSWGRPPAFSKRYAGKEPDVAALRSAAIAAELNQPQADPAAEQLGELAGAELKAGEEGRVSVRFKLAAREAVEKATTKDTRRDYVDKFEASDNLRWSLGTAAPPTSEKPLGRTSSADTEGTTAGGAEQ